MRFGAMEVLELIGTHKTWQVLAALSVGAPEANLTQDAKASLSRVAWESAGKGWALIAGRIQ